MTSDRDLHVGIAGCGRIARALHVPGCVASSGAKIEAFYNHRLDNVSDLVASHPDADFYDDFEEFIAHDGLEPISVCTPNAMHAQMTITPWSGASVCLLRNQWQRLSKQSKELSPQHRILTASSPWARPNVSIQHNVKAREILSRKGVWAYLSGENDIRPPRTAEMESSRHMVRDTTVHRVGSYR